MIKSISLIGFKSFLHRDLNLNKLTVLTGVNSSGKSSVIQSLLMLEKAFEGENHILLAGHGGISDIKNRFSKSDIQLGAETENGSFRIELSEAGYKVLEQDAGFLCPDLWYISADRFGPKTSIPLYSDFQLTNRIGPHGENVLQCIQKYEYESLKEIVKHPDSEGAELIFNVRAWLSVISPNVEFNYSISKQSDSSFSTFDGNRSTNVGFGLSYVLPVITSLLVSTLIPDCTLIIENPEAHLHPKGQTEIGKLIALCSKAGTQVIIETHSDHVFNGIRIETKRSKDFAGTVQFHWFELDANKLTEVSSPFMNDQGKLDEWPSGFFDQFEINASKLI